MSSKLSKFIDDVEFGKAVSNTEIDNRVTDDNIFIVHALIDLLIYKGIFTIDECEVSQINARNCYNVCSVETEISILSNMLR